MGVSVSELRENNKAFAFYFSASWCPPCHAFTPKLVEFYNNTRDTDLEIIFVGFDRDQDGHNAYFEKMPCKAVPYEGDKRQELAEEFEVSGIPHLAITDCNGKILSTGGVGEVKQCTSGGASPESKQALANKWVAQAN